MPSATTTPRRRPTTVLTAHCVRTPLTLPHDVTPSVFSRLVERVVADSHVVSGLDETATGRARVMFTFDDATVDHVDVARVLHQHGVPGIFFVPTGRVGSPGYATWQQVREIADLGHIIGSHSVRHLPLSTLSTAEVKAELVDSRAELEDRVQVPVTYFAPPGGITTPKLHEQVLDAGYTMCRLTAWGVYATGDDPLTVPSVPITEFTMKRGWVTATLDRESLPWAMRVSFGIRAMLPEGLRTRVRAILK
jgi:peptidoglycan/xylan/chitin deacetylase (PgdA/CDA1 family)